MGGHGHRQRPAQGGASDAAIGLLSVAGVALAGFAAGFSRGRGQESTPSRHAIEPGFDVDTPPPSAHPGEAQAGEHGRFADTPTEMPARGWWDILKRTYAEFNDDRLMLVAAGVTFYVLLALFPAVTALVSIYGLFTTPADIGSQLQTVGWLLPSGAMQIIGDQMARVASKDGSELGFGLIFGLGVALWSANAGMKTLFDALNIVYNEKEKRSFVKLTLVTLMFTLAGLLVVILALSSVVLLPAVLAFLHLGSAESWLLFLRWPLLLAVVVLGLGVIYRYAPSRRLARWRWLTPGAAVAAVLWIVFSLLFSWYVQNFGNYDETYGSLGAAIGFMTWIWISTIVVLLGAELNAELEHQTARDTTRPGNRPLGQRGAVMADTVAKVES